MNKVIAINLNGNAYQLEEGGYDALRTYLDGASRRLEGNPDRDEIVADIEQAIAEKCRAALGAYKTVVGAGEVEQILEEMGPVEDPSADAGAAPGAAAPAATAATAAPGGARPEAGDEDSHAAPPVRRLYKIPEGWVSPGVCNGLAVYFNIDVALVRLVFVLLTLFWGVGFVAYLVLIVLLPTARTPEERSAARGPPLTAQEFIRRAKEGYYEGMKTFGEKHAHREWRRRFHHEMRSWRRSFRNEMRAQARGWQPGFQPGFGAWFVLPFVSLLRTVIALAWIFALVSLLATGTVFGIPLPAGFAVWAAVIVLLVAYNFLVWPLKAMRRACYWNAAGGPLWAPPFVHAIDVFIGFGFVILLFWLAVHHRPQIHEALRNIPPLVHEAVEAVKTWWAQ